MKKLIVIICLFLTFFLCYLLQVNFFSWFNLSGIQPNLFIIIALIIGLFSGKRMGITFGVIFGIFLDFWIGKKIGISGIMLGIIGFIGGYLDKKFSKDSRVTMITMVFIATLIGEIGTYILNFCINSSQIGTFNFVVILLTETIFNCIITIIFYPVIIKYGYRIEENFKENKILTRYF